MNDCAHRWQVCYDTKEEMKGWYCHRCAMYIAEPIDEVNYQLDRLPTYQFAKKNFFKLVLLVVFLSVLLDVLFTCYIIAKGAAK